jgi:hypothetical protein
MSVDELKQFYIANKEISEVGAVALLLLMIVLIWLTIRRFRSTAEERKIAAAVKGVATEYVPNAVLPDGIDGYAFIDYLVLTPKAILVVDVQNYNGLLFGGEKIDYWTQMIGHKSYRFENPIAQNKSRVETVKAHVGKIPVVGRVLFGNAGDFPKGIPKGVSLRNRFGQEMAHLVSTHDIPTELRNAWNQLKTLAADTRSGIGPLK